MSGRISFLLFLFRIFRYTETLDLWELQDELVETALSTYKELPVAIRDLRNRSVTVDNIKLALYTENNPETAATINPHYPIVFATQNPIVFIIHGWMSSTTEDWNKKIKDAFLEKNHRCYVVLVDWSMYSKQGYFVAVHDVEEVGSILGGFIVKLYEDYSIPLDNFLLVGHSLGAQISGFIGKKVTERLFEKLPRIIALDAAGPEFQNRSEDRRLNKNDAKVVHVIHTSADVIGFNTSCGTIDFYPNSGDAQPGCLTVSCSHVRSIQYFTEALLHPSGFLGRRCDGWDTYVNETDLCEDVFVSLGDIETKQTGNFYLNTTDKSPYYRRES